MVCKAEDAHDKISRIQMIISAKYPVSQCEDSEEQKLASAAQSVSMRAGHLSSV
jgi:hypothetical protein